VPGNPILPGKVGFRWCGVISITKKNNYSLCENCHATVKHVPVIPVNRVVHRKRIIGKMEGQGGGEAQGVADPHPHPHPKK
jgi:hypothetical protein